MSADLLRRAADFIEQRAAEATPGPWGFTDACDGGYGEWYAITAEGAEVAGSGYEGGGVALDRDALWITTAHPGVAAPLAAWLRVEADLADNPLCAVVDGVSTPIVAWVPATAQPFAVYLARTILGEREPLSRTEQQRRQEETS